MTKLDDKSGIMARLLAAAASAAAAGEVPVAAAIIGADGDVLAMAENRMTRDNNALHHAEMLAIEAATEPAVCCTTRRRHVLLDL